MRILVTGSAGFIGSHLIQALLMREHEVTAIVRPQTPSWKIVCVADQCRTVTGLLGDTALIRQVLDDTRPEACIHLAWHTNPDNYLNAAENITSLTDSIGMLQELIQSECNQVIMAGSCIEYDSTYGYLHEKTPENPTSLYAAAKIACRHISEQLCAQSNTRFCWTRIFYPYGPGENDRRLVPAAINALQKGQPFPASQGDQIRDYIFVEDVVSAICLLAEKKADGIYNIASGQPVSVRHILEMITSIMGHNELIDFGALPPRAWDPPFICGNNQKLRSLGWTPSNTLELGLSQTIDWWESKLTGENMPK